MDKNGVIGNNGNLPWFIPEDLAWFKFTTLGHPIIMGKTTWQSIGKPLPGRQNIVLSRNPDFFAEGATVVPDIPSALELCNDTEVFIIGGASIYEQFLPFADKLYITRIDSEFSGDTRFPEFNRANWQLVDSEELITQSGYKLIFEVYSVKNTSL
jgi:dihydrofolate reductase